MKQTDSELLAISSFEEYLQVSTLLLLLKPVASERVYLEACVGNCHINYPSINTQRRRVDSSYSQGRRRMHWLRARVRCTLADANFHAAPYPDGRKEGQSTHISPPPLRRCLFSPLNVRFVLRSGRRPTDHIACLP